MLVVQQSKSQIDKYSIILGRPTDRSVTASILFDHAVEYYLEYGMDSLHLDKQTSVYMNSSMIPDEMDIVRLESNTQYFYRMKYRQIGAGTYLSTPIYHFHTQRHPGSTFTFTVETDEHLYDKKGVKSLYQICLNNQAEDKPDFMFSLGDIFGDDHNPFTITSQELDVLHKDYRPLLGSICHSIPFYVCLGNHEGEADFYLINKPPNNLAVWATLWRKFYYPNPYPNHFYSGNETLEPYGIGYPENYYAWTWGDALFIVLDVYRDQCDTSPKPKSWNWSLGLPQYKWLKATLESNKSKYKFVFAHHINGQGRGGIEDAVLYEWGGYESNGRYRFSENRPDFEKPIHQLFVDNGVDIFFQGHDHLFAHEVLDGVIYQECPMASDSTYEIGMLANADAYTADTLRGSGHLRITVSPQKAIVEFIRAYLPKDTLVNKQKNREVAFRYEINPLTSSKELNEEKIPFSFYPNPVEGLLNIGVNINETSAVFIEIYDMMGQRIYQGLDHQINFTDFPSGVYTIHFKTGKNNYYQKIIHRKS